MSKYTIIGAALNNNKDVFVDLFNHIIKQDENFTFDFVSLLDKIINLNMCNFTQFIKELNFTKDFKRELYLKGLELSLEYGNLKCLKEYINVLRVVYISGDKVELAMNKQYNDIVKYLLENNVYSNYNNIAIIAAKTGNVDMIRWLFNKYNEKDFNLRVIKLKTNKNSYEQIVNKCNLYLLPEDDMEYSWIRSKNQLKLFKNHLQNDE
jgi:hypothetical protein